MPMAARLLFLAGLALLQSPANADTLRRGLFSAPAISKDSIVFVRGNELWKVPKTGGLATSLKVPANSNSLPKFSPDGQTIALLTSIDGAYELGTVPISGGPVFRVTHYPRNGKGLMQWLPNGRLLYFTESDFRDVESQLYTVPATGGLPTKVAVPYGGDASLNADGERLAYTLNLRRNLYWKHYQGGAAQDIWIYNLRTGQSKQITHWKGYDLRPMWLGDSLYYLSDEGAERAMNVWQYDSRTGKRKQITHRRDHDILNPSLCIETREMIYQWGPDLYVLDLATGAERHVVITIPQEAQVLGPRTVDAAGWLVSRTLSPNGDRAAVEARGDLWLLAKGGGAPINLTRSPGIFERDPAWSPDGRWIACFSDARGEYQLTLVNPASREQRQLTAFKEGFRQSPRWSPDSKRIAFADNAGRMFVCSVEDGEPRQIDADPLGQVNPISWSPDSRWIAYPKYGHNQMSSIWAYNVETNSRLQLTSGMAQDTNPVFDRAGRFLLYFSVRDFSRRVNQVLDRLTAYPTPTMLIAVPLEGDAKRIELKAEDFERRGEPARIPSGRFSGLATGKDGQVFYLRTNPEEPSKLQTLDLSGQEGEKTVLEGVDGFELSPDGSRMLVAKDGKAYVVEPTAEAKLGDPMASEGYTVAFEPADEWAQIARDVWRLYRDYFYDPRMHGLDWNQEWARIQPLLELCATRDDVNTVLGEMISELSVGHAMMASPGDVPGSPWRAAGQLGVDFELENGAYRISKIYEGAAWDPLGKGPLFNKGVHEGDYLLALEGKPLDIKEDPWAPFMGMAGKAVKITVGPNPRVDSLARTVEVTPIGRESDLRLRDWIERNRKYVEKASGGRLGYIYVPDEGASGFAEFVRQFYGQAGKEGLIVDDRWNSGGSSSDRMIEMLNRPLLNAYHERYSTGPFPIPSARIPGPKCLLINRVTSSSGENFAYYFRKAGLGKLIGTRTWGGLIGVNDSQPLIDGGFWWAPQSAFFVDAKHWMPEGIGVAPDIEVMDDPALMKGGKDPQLEAAIKLLLKELAKGKGERVEPPHGAVRR